MRIEKTREERTKERDRVTVGVTPMLLIVQNGPDVGMTLTVPVGSCRLGRGGRSQLVVRDIGDPPTLSREHVTLDVQGADLLVQDHSRNGSWIGDRRLAPQETARLLPGQTLRLGADLLLSRAELRTPEPITRTIESGRGSSPPALPETVFRPGRLRAFLLMPETLQAAWKRVALNRGAAGPDGVTVQAFAAEAEERLIRLQDLLRRGQYEPMPPRLFAAPKRTGGARTISILSVQDRIVQQALHAALQPHLEPLFPPCSYAYRPGVSAHDALRQVDTLLRQDLTWVAETDIASFFDTISHRLLLDQLSVHIPDAFVLSLVARSLAVGAVSSGMGLAQGAATSPLFSNLYLAEFDQHLLACGWKPVRYGDDLIIPCASRNKGQAILAEVEGYLRGKLRLALRAEKTALVPLQQGFTFLGFRFSVAGRQAAPEAVAHLEERLDEAPLQQRKAVLRGWTNYFGAMPSDREETPPAPAEPVIVAETEERSTVSTAVETLKHMSPFRPPDDEWIEKFLKLFAGREGVYARQTSVNGPGAFIPCAGVLTPELVLRHVAGEETLAGYLLHTDNSVRSLVMDIDAARPGGRPPTNGKEEYVLAPVIAFATDLCRLCRSMGLPIQLEDSGQKGRHLWLFFSEPVTPDSARRLARLLATHAGFPRTGVRLEILPRHTEWPGPQLGDAVKLPFGIHPVTGRRCFLLDAEGEPIADRDEALARIRTVDVETVEAVIEKLTDWTRDPAAQQRPKQTTPSAINNLLSGCSVVRGLVEKARKTGHLRHTHNLILLYTAGRLGEEGASFLHQTLALCRNYVPDVCQGYIDRLEPVHPPITCRRIREWLEEEGEIGLCTCAPTRRTPLETVADPSETGQDVANVGNAKPVSSSRPQDGSPGEGTPAAQRPVPKLGAKMAEADLRSMVNDLFEEHREQ